MANGHFSEVTLSEDCSPTTLTGHLEDYRHEEGLRFEVWEPATIYIQTCGSSDRVDTIVYLYDEGRIIGTEYDHDNCGNLNENLDVDMAAGHYTVSVMAWSEGDFDLEVSLCPFESSAGTVNVAIAMAVVFEVILLGANF